MILPQVHLRNVLFFLLQYVSVSDVGQKLPSWPILAKILPLASCQDTRLVRALWAGHFLPANLPPERSRFREDRLSLRPTIGLWLQKSVPSLTVCEPSPSVQKWEGRGLAADCPFGFVAKGVRGAVRGPPTTTTTNLASYYHPVGCYPTCCTTEPSDICMADTAFRNGGRGIAKL